MIFSQFTFSIATVILTLFSSAIAQGLQEETPSIKVHGHRGARGVLPENTLQGFQYALDSGVDVIEMDLVVTQDGKVMVAHDQTLNFSLCRRSSSLKLPKQRDIPVYSLRSFLVRQLDCGSKRIAGFRKQRPVKGAKIPFLEEVFRLIQSSPLQSASTVELHLEIKSVPQLVHYSPAPEEFVKMVNQLITEYKMSKRVVILSFDHRVLVAAKKLNPLLRISALTHENGLNYLALAKSIGADYISPHMSWISALDVKELHAAGVKVVPWTANKQEDWEYLVSLGVDGIVTDYPNDLKLWLQNKGYR